MRHLVLLALVPLRVAAQATSPGDLARHYVAAVKSRNTALQLAIYHPAVIACLNEHPWYRDQIKANAERAATSGARFTDGYRADVTPVASPAPVFLLPDSLFSYPVNPTHEINLLSRDGTEASTAAVLLIVRTPRGWYAVLPCPKPGARRWAEAQLAARSRPQARADSLAAALTDPLKSELLDLIHSGKKVSARDAELVRRLARIE